ncbi:MAG TPA: tripartite tricarboxylate transporter TctB family protein [Geminicoccaceae bacterium]|nr:tripartite tricarboxylate transporter TctB family protein [Geminicoccaceae bacterium]
MLLRLTLRQMEFVAGLVFLALAALVVVEGIRLGPGWGDTGPQPGFFPFALAILMAVGALAAMAQAARRAETGPYFEVHQEIVDLVRVGVPMAVAIALVPVLGLYIMAGFYVAFFSRWYGRFSWWGALASGSAVPLVLYLALDRGCRVPMPHSMWYGTLLPV